MVNMNDSKMEREDKVLACDMDGYNEVSRSWLGRMKNSEPMNYESVVSSSLISYLAGGIKAEFPSLP